ncbi:hypothetical protein [Bradyrhizobium sp. SYSU BS000235]|uniref:hypothetical protein n=1 Tax=Bradyrhizobium sp. SYSU BS000235 TaxID=3411332 RepID=UPI003C7714B6
MKHTTARAQSIRPSYGLVVALAVVAASLQADIVSAQDSPDTENGRFALSPVSEGFLRLDTRTGAVSTCSSVKGSWVCRAVPDERAALDSEIGRLQADNKKLKEQLAQRDTVTGKTDAPLGKEDRKDLDSKSAQTPSDKKAERPLSAEHEKLLALIDRVWDQLLDMAVRLQKKLADKI